MPILNLKTQVTEDIKGWREIYIYIYTHTHSPSLLSVTVLSHSATENSFLQFPSFSQLCLNLSHSIPSRQFSTMTSQILSKTLYNFLSRGWHLKIRETSAFLDPAPALTTQTSKQGLLKKQKRGFLFACLISFYSVLLMDHK